MNENLDRLKSVLKNLIDCKIAADDKKHKE